MSDIKLIKRKSSSKNLSNKFPKKYSNDSILNKQTSLSNSFYSRINSISSHIENENLNNNNNNNSHHSDYESNSFKRDFDSSITSASQLKHSHSYRREIHRKSIEENVRIDDDECIKQKEQQKYQNGIKKTKLTQNIIYKLAKEVTKMIDNTADELKSIDDTKTESSTTTAATITTTTAATIPKNLTINPNLSNNMLKNLSLRQLSINEHNSSNEDQICDNKRIQAFNSGDKYEKNTVRSETDEKNPCQMLSFIQLNKIIAEGKLDSEKDLKRLIKNLKLNLINNNLNDDKYQYETTNLKNEYANNNCNKLDKPKEPPIINTVKLSNTSLIEPKKRKIYKIIETEFKPQPQILLQKTPTLNKPNNPIITENNKIIKCEIHNDKNWINYENVLSSSNNRIILPLCVII